MNPGFLHDSCCLKCLGSWKCRLMIHIETQERSLSCVLWFSRQCWPLFKITVIILQNQGICLISVRMSFCLAPGLTSTLADVLLLTHRCLGAVWMWAKFDIYKDITHSTKSPSSSVLLSWNTSKAAPPCVCNSHCCGRWECICWGVNKHVSILLCNIKHIKNNQEHRCTSSVHISISRSQENCLPVILIIITSIKGAFAHVFLFIRLVYFLLYFPWFCPLRCFTVWRNQDPNDQTKEPKFSSWSCSVLLGWTWLLPFFLPHTQLSSGKLYSKVSPQSNVYRCVCFCSTAKFIMCNK